jgi:plastocyanin
MHGTSRRGLLGAAAGVTGVALAGCLGRRAASGATGAEAETGKRTNEPREGATVAVGPDGSLVFEPARLTVGAGTTVVWEWGSSNHSVTPETVPDGADWRGTGRETRSVGARHVHTFDVAGTYEYVCVPHRGAGMVGTLVVE